MNMNEMGSFQGGYFEVSVVKVKGKMRIGMSYWTGDCQGGGLVLELYGRSGRTGNSGR
jgi:hypothetical protein